MKSTARIFTLLGAGAAFAFAQAAVTQPPEPVDPTPVNGEIYYLINQGSGLQMDLNDNSPENGDNVLQDARSFTSLTQRWAMTKLPDGNWKISNIANGFCLDSASASGIVWTVQDPCGIDVPTQEWSFTYVTNGYSTITNAGTRLVLAASSPAAGAKLIQSAVSGSPAQSQLWLFRPAFWRGDDMSLGEKAEYDRVVHDAPWWHDGYLPGQDLLQIFKNNGMNSIRIRPASISTTVVYGDKSFSLSEGPYNDYTLAPGTSATFPLTSVTQLIPATTTGWQGQHAQTDWSAVDLAHRAKNLGMAVFLDLFYDGGNTSDTPGLWAGKTIAQLAGVPPHAGLVYKYVKQEIELFRANGAMPDIVGIGNEVNDGMFNTRGSGGLSPEGTNATPDGAGVPNASFANFAKIQIAAMQAILDAASDPALGSPIPPPLRCIDTDGNPFLQTFFSTATKTYNIPVEAICQSYYPGWHGPMTKAAFDWHSNGKQVWETNVDTEASGLQLPVYNAEDGVAYETGGSPNDPWYGSALSPSVASRAHEREYYIDQTRVEKNEPNHLGMGMDCWACEATNIGGLAPNEQFWTNGPLGLFDTSTTPGDPRDNAVLPAMLALGGKVDPTLAYKFVNAANGRILETANASTERGASLRTGLDTGVTGPQQEWQILPQGGDAELNGAVYPAPMDHLGDGYFQIVNRNQTNGLNVLDSNGDPTPGSPVVQDPETAEVTAISGTDADQEWDIMTAGNCGDTPAHCTSPPPTAAGDYYMIVNKATGLVLAASGTGAAATIEQQEPAAASNGDWMVPANRGQLWKIFPVHITAAPTAISSISVTASGLRYNHATRSFNGTVTIKNTGAETIDGPFQIVFSALKNPRVRLENATDTFNGSPFLTVPGVVSLAPGQSATVAVRFSNPSPNPSPRRINFKPVIYSGSL